MSPRRQRTRQRRRARILGAAMELVAEEGFEALTINRLADELDVAAGGLYRYFPSKDVLIAALTGQAVEQLSRELHALREGWSARLPEDAAEAALAELVASARWYAALPVERPTLFSLVAQAVAHSGFMVSHEALEPVALPFRALLGQIEGMFVAAAASGALPHEDALAEDVPGENAPDENALGVACEQTVGRDPSDVALMRAVALWSALHGGLLVGKFQRMWPERGRSFTAERRYALVVSGLLRGWGAGEPQLSRALDWARAVGGEMTHATAERGVQTGQAGQAGEAL